jgi:protein-S-isoprenylcysteine O-methyltransferase Ste14
MLKRLLMQTLLWSVIIGLLLFIPAGTIRWWAAWIFLCGYFIGGLVLGIWLAIHDPALLRERQSSIFQPGQKRWDRIFMIIFLLLFLIWFPLMALDAVRFHYSHVPLIVQILGALCLAVFMSLVFLTFRENTYAAAVVKIQKERQHKVITTGPYHYVRHPMYAGALFFFFGIPLLLGSWYGLIIGLLLAILLAIRAYLEEQTLIKELEGYSDYMAQVHYRFIPYIW